MRVGWVWSRGTPAAPPSSTGPARYRYWYRLVWVIGSLYGWS